MEGKISLSKVSEMKKIYKVKVGQSNSTVKQIQEKLYELGYTSQLTTGYYGDITFNNVAYFQIVNGLTVTGWVDSQTCNLINQSYENLNSTSTTEIQTPELVELEDLKWEEVEKPSNWDYIVSSGKQFVLGNFTEDVTVLGTGLQVGAGIIGIDAPMDFRDVTADLANWEWSWPHAFQTTIDIIAFVPVLGTLKYTDEAAVLIKSGDKIFLAKHADEVLTVGKNLDEVINQFDDVVAYIKKHGKLPDNYITSKVAEDLGWIRKKGNLADVAPGKSIGGDIYYNKSKALPDAPGRIWYEADINYTSGYRGNERLLYSNDGLFYKTLDHYSTFIEIGG